MTAGAGRNQDRREETAGSAECREAASVLQDRQRAGGDREDEQQRERKARRDQRVEPQRREDRQVQDADAAALQAQGVDAVPVTQPPTDNEQRDGCCSHQHQAQFDGKHQQPAIDRVLQQEGHAEERDDDPDLDRDVAGGEPFVGRCQRPVEERPRGRGSGRWRQRGAGGRNGLSPFGSRPGFGFGGALARRLPRRLGCDRRGRQRRYAALRHCRGCG